MNLFHIGTEFRRFGHGKLPPLALAVIIMLPLLFGGLFVWSYWDPVGRLRDLPVALVNSDEGATVRGKDIHAGDQIVEKLSHLDSVTFTVVSPEEAYEGINEGRYYFGIELPTDFSEAAVSANSEHPHQAKLNAVFNNNNGFLATMLGNQAVNQVLASINENLGSQVAEQLLVGFNTIGDGLHTAGEGANQLADGAKQANDGGAQLSQGSQELDGGAQELAQGAHALAQGMDTLDQGIKRANQGSHELADGLNQLDDATNALGDGAGQVAAGVDQVVGFANQAKQAQDQVIAPLITISTQLRASQIPQAIDLANQADHIIADIRANGFAGENTLIGSLHKLSAGANEIHRQLSDPSAPYRAGVSSARDGSASLASGLDQLAEGSGKLVIGTHTLADGTSKLAAGTTQLSVGAQQLSSGLVQLDEGSNTLALKLNESADKVPQFPKQTIDDAAKNVSTPVAENLTKDSLTLFGVGLAPMFICIGLFVGSTVSWMVLRPLQRRAIESGMSGLRVALASYLPAIIVGTGQSLVMFAVQKQFIGLTAATEIGLLLAMCLSSYCFLSITQCLNAVFGSTVGRVLCIAFMSLQVVSSGGLYPPETQPAPLRWFHTYDPMTYAVNIIRHAINGTQGFDSRVMVAFIVLLGVICLSVFLSSLAALRERQMKLKDLHPEVSV